MLDDVYVNVSYVIFYLGVLLTNHASFRNSHLAHFYCPCKNSIPFESLPTSLTLQRALSDFTKRKAY